MRLCTIKKKKKEALPRLHTLQNIFFHLYHFFSVWPQQLLSATSTKTTSDVITIIFFFSWKLSEWPFLPLSPLLDKMPPNAIIEVQRSVVTLKSSPIALDQNQMK